MARPFNIGQLAQFIADAADCDPITDGATSFFEKPASG